jgi:hypothetical protein
MTLSFFDRTAIALAISYCVYQGTGSGYLGSASFLFSLFVIPRQRLQ